MFKEVLRGMHLYSHLRKVEKNVQGSLYKNTSVLKKTSGNYPSLSALKY